MTWIGALSGVVWLAACTPFSPQTRPSSDQQAESQPATGQHSTQARGAGCLATVRGVIDGPGQLQPTWLPPGFRRSARAQVGLAAPTENFVRASAKSDPPRLELGFAEYSGTLASYPGSGGHGTGISIQGHRGRLDARQRLVSAYWKPDQKHLLSVTGYKLPASVVETVARNVWFDPPGLVPLPVRPGRVVARKLAIMAARRASRGRTGSNPVAKLTSLAEADLLLQAAHAANALAQIPAAGASARWQPIWVVATDQDQVLVNAGSGTPVAVVQGRARPAWFTALTDRSRVSARCQGGSRSRVPYGVLTRDEETYLAGGQAPAAGQAPGTSSVLLKLTTVPAVNSADPGMYGGCVVQNCQIMELLWAIIIKVRARPGTTIPCLPPSASYPPGYRPRQVTQYYAVDVPGNYGIYCHNPPGAILALKDLAPPVR